MRIDLEIKYCTSCLYYKYGKAANDSINPCGCINYCEPDNKRLSQRVAASIKPTNTAIKEVTK